MVGTHREEEFDKFEYNEFYEHHNFEPTPEKVCLEINEYIPRFGWAFDQVEKLKPKNLLDLGCLDGSFALTVSKQLGIPVAGIDLTVDGIELAKERAKKFELPASFYQGTIEQEILGFDDHAFDVVTFFEVIEHVEDVQKLLKLIDRVLAPGGSVLVSTPDFESPHYGADDEKNKCHIRLYTTAKDHYERPNKYGNVRKATSIYKEIGEQRIQEVAVHNELINLRYK